MVHGYTVQNRTVRELETATTDAVDLIADLEAKVTELETEVESLRGDIEKLLTRLVQLIEEVIE